MKRPLLAVAVATAFALTAGAVQGADPSTAECLAATESSVKLGNDHKLRAERAQFLVCAAASCPTDIRKDCASQVESVSAQIPTIIFEAKDPSGADINAVKVTMDGEVLAERLEGTALSIDPGEHTFAFETAGQPPVTRKFTIQQAQKDRHERITFGTITPAPSARLTVSADSNALVMVDDAPLVIGKFDGALAPGTHNIRVTESGKIPYASSVDLHVGENRTLEVSLESEKHGTLLWPWIVGGAAVAAGAAVGGYFLFKSNGASGQSAPPDGTLAPGTVMLHAHARGFQRSFGR
jgi:hypothetical protein